MNFFFSFGVFCLAFMLVASEYHRNVKTDLKRVRRLVVCFIITLIFSYLIDLTKWLILMAHEYYVK